MIRLMKQSASKSDKKVDRKLHWNRVLMAGRGRMMDVIDEEFLRTELVQEHWQRSLTGS